MKFICSPFLHIIVSACIFLFLSPVVAISASVCVCVFVSPLLCPCFTRCCYCCFPSRSLSSTLFRLQLFFHQCLCWYSLLFRIYCSILILCAMFIHSDIAYQPQYHLHYPTALIWFHSLHLCPTIARAPTSVCTHRDTHDGCVLDSFSNLTIAPRIKNR